MVAKNRTTVDSVWVGKPTCGSQRSYPKNWPLWSLSPCARAPHATPVCRPRRGAALSRRDVLTMSIFRAQIRCCEGLPQAYNHACPRTYDKNKTKGTTQTGGETQQPRARNAVRPNYRQSENDSSTFGRRKMDDHSRIQSREVVLQLREIVERTSEVFRPSSGLTASL